MRKRALGTLLATASIVTAALTGGTTHAQPVDATAQETKTACAVRLSEAIYGMSPDAALLSSVDPTSLAISRMTTSPYKETFVERFARFINSQFNDNPGQIGSEDAPYYMAYVTLNRGLAWDQMFIGPYSVATYGAYAGTPGIEGEFLADLNTNPKYDSTLAGSQPCLDPTKLCAMTGTTIDDYADNAANGGQVQWAPIPKGGSKCFGGGCVFVSDDPNGVGYFRSPAWTRRYAGTEQAGIRLMAANQIMQNVIGITLVPVTNSTGATDLSASGRMASPCNGCHYEGAYALDLVAKVLGTKVLGGYSSFKTYAQEFEINVQPQMLFGQNITDLKDLVTALVDSDAFRFRTCRLAFKYLYGREENACEAPLFDACMNAFPAASVNPNRKVQDALAAIVKDASFCQ
jgi:hypothetical protein